MVLLPLLPPACVLFGPVPSSLQGLHLFSLAGPFARSCLTQRASSPSNPTLKTQLELTCVRLQIQLVSQSSPFTFASSLLPSLGHIASFFLDGRLALCFLSK